jgi:DNA modification methylase
MKNRHKIIIADSRTMPEIPDRSVHLVVTSPPYWQLKDYGDDGQIGFHHSYEDYINNLNLVWNECHRVLHDGCRLCINIGDQFARSAYYGRYKVIPIRTEIIKFCESVGFDYMGAIIWRKVTTCNTTGGATVMGSFPYPRNGILKLDYEFILILKKPGRTPQVSGRRKEGSRLSTREWNEYFSGHWSFPGEKQKGHLAMFPLELPRRLIRMFTFQDDTVLDPFLGSGTTSRAARQEGRSSIGYEINEDFLPLIKEKLGLSQGNIFEPEEIEVKKEAERRLDFQKQIQQLPYIFHDPVGFDRKADPRKRSFGSNIDGTVREREKYYSVREIISPSLVRLHTGQIVRLLGIREDPRRADEAVRFLRQKALGQKVYLRFDGQRHGDEPHRPCYVYLKNRTFLNAHLIKNGLALPNPEEGQIFGH